MPPSSDGEKSDTEVYFYECPVYSTPLRGDFFILAVHLPTHRPDRIGHCLTFYLRLVSAKPFFNRQVTTGLWLNIQLVIVSSRQFIDVSTLFSTNELYIFLKYA